MGQKVSHRIDILVDHHLQPTILVEPRQGKVPLVGLSVPHLRVAFDLSPPVLPAGSRVGQKLRQLDGPYLFSNALGTSKIGDTAFI